MAESKYSLPQFIIWDCMLDRVSWKTWSEYQRFRASAPHRYEIIYIDAPDYDRFAKRAGPKPERLVLAENARLT